MSSEHSNCWLVRRADFLSDRAEKLSGVTDVAYGRIDSVSCCAETASRPIHVVYMTNESRNGRAHSAAGWRHVPFGVLQLPEVRCLVPEFRIPLPCGTTA